MLFTLGVCVNLVHPFLYIETMIIFHSRFPVEQTRFKSRVYSDPSVRNQNYYSIKKLYSDIEAGKKWLFFRKNQDVNNEQLKKDINCHWKCRLSIHPEDYEKSFSIILKFLLSEAGPTAFKMIDKTTLTTSLQKLEHKLDELKKLETKLVVEQCTKTFYQIIRFCLENGSSFTVFPILHALFSTIRLYFYDQQERLSYLKSQLTQTNELLDERYHRKQRFNQGMQYTIYLSQGEELRISQVLKQTEEELIKQGVRSGKRTPTDMPLSDFVSIRHPGLTYYHNALSVANCNPDNAPNPFIEDSSISKIWPSAQL